MGQTHFDVHFRFSSDMQSNLGKRLHVLKRRRLVCSETVGPSIYLSAPYSLPYIQELTVSKVVVVLLDVMFETIPRKSPLSKLNNERMTDLGVSTIPCPDEM